MSQSIVLAIRLALDRYVKQINKNQLKQTFYNEKGIEVEDLHNKIKLRGKEEER